MIRIERLAYVVPMLMAVAYSSYLIGRMLSDLIGGHEIPCMVIAVLLSFSLHIFARDAVSEAKGMSIGRGMLMFLLIASVCIYGEMKGVDVHAFSQVDTLSHTHSEEIARLEHEAQLSCKEIERYSDWNQGNANWNRYSSWKEAIAREKQVLDRIEQARHRHEKEMDSCIATASSDAMSLKGGVAISMAVLLISAMGSVRKPKEVSPTPALPADTALDLDISSSTLPPPPSKPTAPEPGPEQKAEVAEPEAPAYIPDRPGPEQEAEVAEPEAPAYIPDRPGPLKVVMQKPIERMVELRAKGLTHQQISEEIGCSRTKVSKDLKRYDTNAAPADSVGGHAHRAV